MKRVVAIGERGLRVGEDAGRAKLTDGEVDLLRRLHHEHGMPYATLAEKFEVSVSLVGKICRYQRRAETPTGYRTVEVHTLVEQ